MVEISFWNPGDEKVRVIHTTDDIDTVMARIELVNEGQRKYASFSYPTGSGKVYIPSSVLRECVVIVTVVADKSDKSLVL